MLSIRNIAVAASAALALFAGATACSTQKADAPITAKPAGAEGNVGAVLNQPLADLNISGTDIPPLLTGIAAAPYAAPPHADCDGLARDIDALTAVLGPDLAPAKGDAGKPIITQDGATDAAWDAARSAAVGWIPFRGVVRYLTGAERHDAKVKAVVLAGFVRRAYLKGLRGPLNCPVAAPAPPPAGATAATP